jgi:predicted aspartyl protease
LQLPACLILSLALLWPARLAAGALDSVPFELCGGHLVVVRGSVGTLERVRFLVDTGTTRTVVDNGIVKKLRLKRQPGTRPFAALNGSGKAYALVLPSLQFGPTRVDRMSSLATDLSRISGCGRIDGIVGLDLLRLRSFDLDYRSRRITFDAIPEPRWTIPFQTLAPLLSVDVTIGGQPVRLMVDTAAAGLVLFPRRLPSRLAHPGLPHTRTIPTATGPTTVGEGDVSDVRLGPTRWPGRAALVDVSSEVYHGLEGVLGGMPRAVGRVTFDFQGNRFGWEE